MECMPTLSKMVMQKLVIVIGIVMFLKKEIHYVLLENKNVIVKTCTGKHILLTQNQVKRYVLRPRTGHVENVCYLTKRKYQTLEGENIILRKAKEDDLDSIWKNVWIDKSIADNMLWEVTTTLEDAKLRLKRTINYQKINYALHRKSLSL